MDVYIVLPSDHVLHCLLELIQTPRVAASDLGLHCLLMTQNLVSSLLSTK